MIHSPYKEPRDMPIQGISKPETDSLVELKEEFGDCLKDTKASRQLKRTESGGVLLNVFNLYHHNLCGCCLSDR